jgi:hypothetical protein
MSGEPTLSGNTAARTVTHEPSAVSAASIFSMLDAVRRQLVGVIELLEARVLAAVTHAEQIMPIKAANEVDSTSLTAPPPDNTAEEPAQVLHPTARLRRLLQMQAIVARDVKLKLQPVIEAVGECRVRTEQQQLQTAQRIAKEEERAAHFGSQLEKMESSLLELRERYVRAKEQTAQVREQLTGELMHERDVVRRANAAAHTLGAEVARLRERVEWAERELEASHVQLAATRAQVVAAERREEIANERLQRRVKLLTSPAPYEGSDVTEKDDSAWIGQEIRMRDGSVPSMVKRPPLSDSSDLTDSDNEISAWGLPSSGGVVPQRYARPGAR